ncbi:MAG TPA: extracellular solute-binding protein [Candidatus Binatia bacterium]
MAKSKRWALKLSVSFFIALISGGAPVASAQSGGELVIYSGRREPLIMPVIDLFKKATGIQVTLKSGEDQALAQLVLQEQPSPVGDVYLTVDSGLLEFLRLKAVLQSYSSDATRKISERFRAADGAWVGASGRGRAMMYNTNLVKADDLPKSVFDIVQPKWKGKIGLDSLRKESTLAWITSVRIVKGEAFTGDFVRKLKENQAVFLDGGPEVRKGVGRGQVALGLLNHYHYNLEAANKTPVGVHYPDQGASDIGILVNAAGAAIVKGAKHAKEGRAFVDFLVSAEAQKVFAELNFEWPLLPGVQTADGVRPLDKLKQTPVSLDKLGKELQNTLDFLDKTGVDVIGR